MGERKLKGNHRTKKGKKTRQREEGKSTECIRSKTAEEKTRRKEKKERQREERIRSSRCLSSLDVQPFPRMAAAFLSFLLLQAPFCWPFPRLFCPLGFSPRCSFLARLSVLPSGSLADFHCGVGCIFPPPLFIFFFLLSLSLSSEPSTSPDDLQRDL